MAQSDQVVQNATFPSVRADINDNLMALFTQSSGNSAPSTTVAHQPWIDTGSSPPIWKVRNGSNSAWITIGTLDPAGFKTQGSSITQAISIDTTSGTSIDFTTVPAWVKRITVTLAFVSTTGSSPLLLRIGTSGGVNTSGYVSCAGFINGDGTVASGINTTGYLLTGASPPSTIEAVFTIVNDKNNEWLFSGTSQRRNITGAFSETVGTHSGHVDAGALLTRVRITTVNGTDTFDGGRICILYEG
jgi:hypothetical protein